MLIKKKVRMVRPAGFEPAAYSLGNCRSILLSYGRTVGRKIVKTASRIYTFSAIPGQAQCLSATRSQDFTISGVSTHLIPHSPDASL